MTQMRRKIGYGLGDMGLSISYFSVGFFLIYYLTDIVGLEPYLAGLAYFIGRAWDSTNDPLVGAISDRTNSRFGRKRVYLLFGALPFAVSFILLWMIPLEGSQALKFAFATIAIVLYTTLYSVVSVPYVALVPVMTNEYDERTQIVGIRSILSTLGTLLGGGVAMLVSSFDSELTGLRVMAFSFALFLLVTIFVAAQSVHGLEKQEKAKSITFAAAQRFYLRLMADRNVSTLMIFKFLGAISTGLLMASLPYYSKHILGDEGVSTIGLAIYILLTALFIPFWEFLARRYDKRRLLLISMSILAVLLIYIGLFISNQSLLAFYIGCGLMGMIMSAYVLLAFSFPPDLVDYNEQKTGNRDESLIFGLWQTSHQLGAASAGLILGLFLQVFRYDGAAAEQSPQALLGVRLSLGVLPGLAMIAAVAVLQRYGITRRTYQEIRQALDSRQPTLP